MASVDYRVQKMALHCCDLFFYSFIDSQNIQMQISL